MYFEFGIMNFRDGFNTLGVPRWPIGGSWSYFPCLWPDLAEIFIRVPIWPNYMVPDIMNFGDVFDTLGVPRVPAGGSDRLCSVFKYRFG